MHPNNADLSGQDDVTIKAENPQLGMSCAPNTKISIRRRGYMTVAQTTHNYTDVREILRKCDAVNSYAVEARLPKGRRRPARQKGSLAV